MAKISAASNYSDYNDLELEEPFDYDYSEIKLFLSRMSSVSTFQEITDIIKFVLYIIVVIADIYLIVIISRNPKLKAAKSNRLIMHYCIFNLIYTLTKPISTIFMELLGLWKYIGLSIWCCQDEAENSGLLGMFLSALGLSIHWLVTVHCKNVKPIFLKLHNNLIFIIYIILLLNIIIGFIICHATFVNWSLLPQLIFSVIIIIFVLVCNCKIKATDKRKNYPLTIANVIIMSWIPIFVYLILYGIFIHNYTGKFILFVTLFIPEYLAYGSPITVIISLWYINKHFKVAFQKSYSCCKCCNSNSDYGLENHFEDSDEDISTDNFENKAELL